VGKNLKILLDASIDKGHCWHIAIENDVTLAHDASTKTHLSYTRIGNIGDRVFIGVSAIVLPGVTI